MYISNNRTRIALKIPLLLDVTASKDQLSGVPDQKKITEEVIHALDRIAEDESLNDGFHYEYVTFEAHYSALNTLPTVPGTRWPVSKPIFDYFYDVMPPASFPGGYIVPEAQTTTDDGRTVYSAYYRRDGHYWHEYVAK